jgi:RNA polymerase primary sigma factor
MQALRSYLQQIKKIPLLSADEELELSRRVQQGDIEARMKMVKSNLRLVISIAKRYSHFGVPLMDLIEEGNMGLMKAVSKYDPKMKYRFSTYAAFWIRQYITRALANQAKTIRVPVYMVETINKWKKTAEKLSQKHGRRPRLKEIARAMKISLKRAREIKNVVTSTSSLEAPVGKDQEGRLKDLIEDISTPTASEELMQFLREERVSELLKMMPEREQDVLSLRFGLKDGANRTLEEIAGHLNITRERVRQIEESALKKLRSLIKEQETV